MNTTANNISMWSSIKRIDDEKENVAKFVFTKEDAVVESVLYKYPDYTTRTVICCSTQSGCPVGCRFCGTGDYFVRSLTSEEIISQVDHCFDQTGANPANIQRAQIMFMSMGEPLLNLKALIPALHTLHDKYPKASLLISTSAPVIDLGPLFQLSKDIPAVGLQFSVHESTDEARDALIPFKKKMTLAQIAASGASWKVATGRKPFFNYCAHDNNSSNEDADRILNLFDPSVFCATVSVVCERSEGMAVANDHQRSLAIDFASKLVLRGYDTRVFDPAGQDTIGGGCGQLHFVQKWFRDHPNMARPSCGNGRPEVHTPTRKPHDQTGHQGMRLSAAQKSAINAIASRNGTGVFDKGNVLVCAGDRLGFARSTWTTLHVFGLIIIEGKRATITDRGKELVTDMVPRNNQVAYSDQEESQ